MMKVLINKEHGGFSVSKEVYEELGIEWDSYGYLTHWPKANWIDTKSLRTHPDLIAAVEKVGIEESNGGYSKLKIVEIPFNSTDGWIIQEYDGLEWIAEDHRTW